jgi:hypothetical protein
MKLAQAIVRYTPLISCALLVIAWILSAYVTFGATLKPGSNLGLGISCHFGNVACWGTSGNASHVFATYHGEEEIASISWRTWLGGFQFSRTFWNEGFVHVPFPLVLSVLLPPAVGIAFHYRFPLWSWFAWTALLAGELAYYLR